MYYYNDYLQHFGVKGMKWGVRRFQDKNGRLTNAGKKRYSDDGDKSKTESAETKRKGLTDKQKKYIKIGATVAATALLAYGGYKLSQSGKLQELIKKGKNVTENIGGIETLKQYKTKPKTVTETIKNINPTKSRTNCRACSIASSLRLMGFDVEAVNVQGGSFSSAIEKCFTGTKISEMYNPSRDKITNYISRKFKEGDYGAIASTFNINGREMGHAYNWIIEKGKVRFFDGQKEIDDFSKYLDFISPSKSTEIVGLKDATLNLEGLYEFIKNRK